MRTRLNIVFRTEDLSEGFDNFNIEVEKTFDVAVMDIKVRGFVAWGTIERKSRRAIPWHEIVRIEELK